MDDPFFHISHWFLWRCFHYFLYWNPNQLLLLQLVHIWRPVLYQYHDQFLLSRDKKFNWRNERNPFLSWKNYIEDLIIRSVGSIITLKEYHIKIICITYIQKKYDFAVKNIVLGKFITLHLFISMWIILSVPFYHIYHSIFTLQNT